MRREAAGKLEEALKIYDLILDVEEANAVSGLSFPPCLARLTVTFPTYHQLPHCPRGPSQRRPENSRSSGHSTTGPPFCYQQGIWKRRVAVYRQLGETQLAAEDLCEYLDTCYTDVEGWLELADIYSSAKE